MNELQRCPGYMHHQVEHMVPVNQFDKTSDICKGCRKISNDKHNPKNNAIITLTEKYLAQRVRRKHPRRKEIHAFAKEVYNDTKTEQELQEFIEEIEAEAWLGTIFPRPSKDDLPANKPARKRTNLEPLDKLPPEGWVYIIAASRHASIMKIGSTFEYGIRDRLSEAKRWALAGSAVLLHKEWFSRCKQAESLVHKRLDYYRIVSPDAGDELFRTSFEHALANVMIIKNEVENDRKEQAMG